MIRLAMRAAGVSNLVLYMHDETDERRLKEIERLRETGGTIENGDGTTTRIGSKFGTDAGRASCSDGREYREDEWGRMRRDPMAERTPDVEWQGPQMPSWKIDTGSWNDCNVGLGCQLKLGLALFTLGLGYQIFCWFHGFFLTSPGIFVPSFGLGFFAMRTIFAGWLRAALTWFAALYVLFEVLERLNKAGLL